MKLIEFIAIILLIGCEIKSAPCFIDDQIEVPLKTEYPDIDWDTYIETDWEPIPIRRKE